MTGLDPGSVSTALAVVDQLPEPIKKSAIQTIAKVVGSVTAIPDALIKRFSQGLNDKTDAKSEVWKRVGAAIGDRIVADEDLMDRATVSLMGEAYRKQENKESVAQEAVSNLIKDNPPAEETVVPPVEDDWINVFSSHAENASSERLRQMWGRILAGEIRRPGSFSLSTMRFIAELDRSTAEAFDRIGGQIYSGSLNRAQDFESDISPFLYLEEAGLLSDGSGNLSQTLTIDLSGVSYLHGVNSVMKVQGDPGAKVAFGSMPLTRVAKELLPLLPSFDDIAGAQNLVSILDKTSLTSIELLPVLGRVGTQLQVGQPLVLWVKTVVSAPQA